MVAAGAAFNRWAGGSDGRARETGGYHPAMPTSSTAVTASTAVTGAANSPTALDPDLAARVQVVFCDVDGVLTDGGMTYGAVRRDAGGIDRDAIHGSPLDDVQPLESKRFHVRDGMAAVLLRLAGLKVVFITGERTEMVRRRAAKLKLDGCIDGCDDKAPAAAAWLARHGLTPAAAMHIGDEVNDIGLMRTLPLSLAPADCSPVVADVASVVLATPGGHGVLREAAYALLTARGELVETIERYISGERPGTGSAT